MDVIGSRLHQVSRTFLIGLVLFASETLLFTTWLIDFFGKGNDLVGTVQGSSLTLSIIWALVGIAVLSGCALGDASLIVKTNFLSSISSFALTVLLVLTTLSSVINLSTNGEFVFSVFGLYAPLILVVFLVGGIVGGYVGSWIREHVQEVYNVFLALLSLTAAVSGGFVVVSVF